MRNTIRSNQTISQSLAGRNPISDEFSSGKYQRASRLPPDAASSTRLHPIPSHPVYGIREGCREIHVARIQIDAEGAEDMTIYQVGCITKGNKYFTTEYACDSINELVDFLNDEYSEELGVHLTVHQLDITVVGEL